MKTLWPILLIFALLIPISPVGNALLQQGQQQLSSWQDRGEQRWSAIGTWWQSTQALWQQAWQQTETASHDWLNMQHQQLSHWYDATRHQTGAYLEQRLQATRDWGTAGLTQLQHQLGHLQSTLQSSLAQIATLWQAPSADQAAMSEPPAAEQDPFIDDAIAQQLQAPPAP